MYRILSELCNFCNSKIFARGGGQMEMCSRCIECDSIIVGKLRTFCIIFSMDFFLGKVGFYNYSFSNGF